MARTFLARGFSARYPLTIAGITPDFLKIVDKRTVGRKHGRLGRPLPYRHLLADGVISSDCPHRASTACSRSRPKEAASAFVHLLLASKSPTLCERVTLCAKRRPVDVAVARCLQAHDRAPAPLCQTTSFGPTGSRAHRQETGAPCPKSPPHCGRGQRQSGCRSGHRGPQ